MNMWLRGQKKKIVSHVQRSRFKVWTATWLRKSSISRSWFGMKLTQSNEFIVVSIVVAVILSLLTVLHDSRGSGVRDASHNVADIHSLYVREFHRKTILK